MVDSLSAPVRYGEKVGEVRASLDGEEIFYSDIVTTGEVGELNFFSSLLIIIRRFSQCRMRNIPVRFTRG